MCLGVVVACNDWNQSFAELFKLELSLWIEKWERSQIDRGCWILGINDNGVGGSGSLTTIADSDIAKEILGVLEI
jgi:hypothetical protein